MTPEMIPVENLKVAQGVRVKQARKTIGLSQRELAERIGTSQTTLCHLERGGSNFSHYGPAIASQCGVALCWMESGKGQIIDVHQDRDDSPVLSTAMEEPPRGKPSDKTHLSEPLTALATHGNAAVNPLMIQPVPLFKWEDLLRIAEEVTTIYQEECQSTFLPPRPVGPRAFALTVAAHGTELPLHENDIVVLDPDAQPKHNSLVLAVLNGDQAIFAHCHHDGSLRYLETMDKHGLMMEMNKESCVVLSVLVHYREYLTNHS